MGYVVVGYEEGSTEGQIVDLLAIKDRLDVADALFTRACECLSDLGMNTVFYQVVERHPYHELSRRHGFLDSRSRPNIKFSSVRGGEDTQFLKYTAPNQVYFNYATTL